MLLSTKRRLGFKVFLSNKKIKNLTQCRPGGNSAGSMAKG